MIFDFSDIFSACDDCGKGFKEEEITVNIAARAFVKLAVCPCGKKTRIRFYYDGISYGGIVVKDTKKFAGIVERKDAAKANPIVAFDHPVIRHDEPKFANVTTTKGTHVEKEE